ncbi:hypothetical protein J1614_001348 [Plenodomus biglobosus]|nr:hypothetical protein J1614_001348 [Plenodomus biglobosus]
MVSKMSSLMDLVAQNQPKFQTHQALLVIGMQNDFLLPDGRLPVNIKKGFLERIQTLIPKFRELNGNVIWVQTLYEADRIASDPNTGEGDALVVGGLVDGDESSTEGGDEEPAMPIKEAKDLPPAQSRSSKHKQRALDLLKRVSARRKTIPQEVAKATAEEDDELFLLKSERKSPACVPNTFGAEFADVIARQFELPADSVIRTTNYSAFQGTNLLMTLRARLVTELYICGCITNVSVLATVIDAARHGVKINVIQDCLGYRKQTRHDLALKRMDEFFDAYLVDSEEILAKEPPLTEPVPSSPPNGFKNSSKGNEKSADGTSGRLSQIEESRPTSRTSSPRSPTAKVLSGKQRTLSLVSVAENRKAAQSTASSTVKSTVEPNAEASDKDFSDMLVRGATVPGTQEAEAELEKPKLVKTKIRMRSKEKKKKKRDKEKEKEKEEGASKEKSDDVVAIGECITPTSNSTAAETTTTTATTTANSPPATIDSQRTSWIAKAGSVMDLREKESRPQSLKSVASQPVMSSNSEEKDRNRLSDLSDRVRSSLSRAPKSESSESKKSVGGSSTKTVAMTAPANGTDKKVDHSAKKPTEKAPPPIPVPIAETPVKSAEIEEIRPIPPRPSVPTGTPKIKGSRFPSLATLPLLGPKDTIGEGDSSVIYDFFPPTHFHPSDPSNPLNDIIFKNLYNEVRWQKMLHQQGEVPRLVCCQGAFGDDGSMPIYRHPSDQTLPLLHFSPKVDVVRRQAEKIVGHALNHVLIQLYRSGSDYISEHSDKTLDIVAGSSIVNVSFGAQRTMRLRTKRTSPKLPTNSPDSTKERTTQRIPLPHNSLFILGPATNASNLHGIMPDKRLPHDRSPAELNYDGMRISLTFRHIGTFIDASETTIWGHGATAKEQRDAADVINGDAEESEKLVRAFGKENAGQQEGKEGWEECYGAGSDVLHLKSVPEGLGMPMLFLSGREVEDKQVQICLAEAKVKHTTVAAPTLDEAYDSGVREVLFRDTDIHHTEVTSASSILLYLDRYHPLNTSAQGRLCNARAYNIIRTAENLLAAWRASNTREVNIHVAMLEEQLGIHSGPFIAGSKFSIADAALWPIIDTIISSAAGDPEAGDDTAEGWKGWNQDEYPSLSKYHEGTWKKKASVKKVKERLTPQPVLAPESTAVLGTRSATPVDSEEVAEENVQKEGIVEAESKVSSQTARKQDMEGKNKAAEV